MSISIFCKKNRVLKCRNMQFEILHEKIEFVIERDNLNPPKNILIMLREMDQKIYGGGGILVDIADYIKTEKDSNLFNSLLNKAIKEYEIEYPDVPQEYRDLLWEFYNELVMYGKELHS